MFLKDMSRLLPKKYFLRIREEALGLQFDDLTF